MRHPWNVVEEQAKENFREHGKDWFNWVENKWVHVTVVWQDVEIIIEKNVWKSFWAKIQ